MESCDEAGSNFAWDFIEECACEISSTGTLHSGHTRQISGLRPLSQQVMI